MTALCQHLFDERRDSRPVQLLLCAGGIQHVVEREGFDVADCDLQCQLNGCENM